MRQLTLPLAERSYDIYIEEGLLILPSLLAKFFTGKKVLILSNETIAPLYLARLKRSLSDKQVFQFIIEDGETYKNLTNFSRIIDFLIENKFRRNDTLVALGGGVVGDLGGFVAASFQRGMGFIQAPTSLLAQVDSSVGGKTAVNHSLGKNMIGAFYQPKAVLIDLNTLDTLPEREYISGFAEIVKYALIGDIDIKRLLKSQTAKILARDKLLLSELVYLSCSKKAQIVAEDEIESGTRALLNLGHSFAHAIEKVTEYKEYLHGEAVSIGIQMALNLSLKKGIISSASANEYTNILSSLGLPLKTKSTLSIDELVAAMVFDKKNMNDNFRLVLPTDKHCLVVEENDLFLIKQAIAKQLN